MLGIRYAKTESVAKTCNTFYISISCNLFAGNRQIFFEFHFMGNSKAADAYAILQIELH